MPDAGEAPPPVVSAGGVVIREGRVLLVRLTYGAQAGRYIFPGGRVDPGETLDEAVVREVREETGVEASVEGLIGVRTRRDGLRNDTYAIFLLQWRDGEPAPDGRECDDARFFDLAGLRAVSAITPLTRLVSQRALTGEYRLLPRVEVSQPGGRGPGPDAYHLFM